MQALTGAELAYASSAVNFLRQLGGAAGVNLLAVFLEKRLNVLDAAQAPRAFHECFILVAIAFAGRDRSGMVRAPDGELAMYSASWLPTTDPTRAGSPSTSART